MNSCWPAQTIFNYYNKEKTFVIGNETAVFGDQLKETWMNFANVVLYVPCWLLFIPT